MWYLSCSWKLAFKSFVCHRLFLHFLLRNRYYFENKSVTNRTLTLQSYYWPSLNFCGSMVTSRKIRPHTNLHVLIFFIFVRLSSACTRILHWLFPEAQCDSSRQTQQEILWCKTIQRSWHWSLWSLLCWWKHP